ncbi:MAG: hypothetical protein E7556_07660 [Ruminococcaceae bacterium]|nr:hypothetical protein [Oscillospiraceae bacterium]
MKKCISLILAFVFVIGVFATVPLTPIANAASVDDLIFELNEDGTMYQVKDCDKDASGELVIPSTYNGLPVTKIGSNAFIGCTSLTNVTIPDSVTIIGSNAFIGCTSLTNVTIPDSVTSIGDAAFYGCTSLTNVTIPDSVTIIGNFAFYSCESLTNVTIPDSVTSIGGWAFYDCESLTNVTIPDSVTSIVGWAFGYKYDSWEEKEEKIPGFTIYGAKNSEAERYATANGFTFIETEETKPHKHTYTSSVTKQPSYTETGVKTFTCTICGDSYTEVIPKLEKLKSPTITSITSEQNGIKFTWQKVNGTEGYIIFKLVQNEAGEYVYQQLAVVGPSTLAFTDQTAVDGETYCYAVASMDAMGNAGQYSEFAHTYKKLTTLSTPKVSVKSTSSGVKVSWKAIENAETYTVYRRTYNAKTKKWGDWKKLKSGYTKTSFTDKKAKLGTKYRYTVKAVNGSVKSKYKSTDTIKYNVTPTVKVAKVSNGVKVTWSTAANATSYKIYRSTYNTKTKEWGSWKGLKTAKATSKSYTDKSAKKGVKYRYTVRAVNGSYKSTFKASGSVKR